MRRRTHTPAPAAPGQSRARQDAKRREDIDAKRRDNRLPVIPRPQPPSGVRYRSPEGSAVMALAVPGRTPSGVRTRTQSS